MVVKLWSLCGYPKYRVPYYNSNPKRNHNFDNHPYGVSGVGLSSSCFRDHLISNYLGHCTLQIFAISGSDACVEGISRLQSQPCHHTCIRLLAQKQKAIGSNSVPFPNPMLLACAAQSI